MTQLWVATVGAFGLLAVVLGLFRPALTGEPIWDDRGYVVGNPALLDPGALKAAFLSDANQGANPAMPVSGLYRPLAFASYHLNARLLGAGPAALHLGNLLLHALSATLLFLFLLGRLPADARGRAAAGLVAALWAIHPEQAEPVAWISGRYDLLGTCLLLAALLLQDRPGRLAPAVQGLLVLGAALSKESFVPAAGVLLIDDWARGAPGPRWRRALPLGLALLAWGWLRSRASLEPLLASQGARPLAELARDYLSTLGIYAARAVAPLPLSLDQPYQPLAGPALGLVVAGVGAAALAARRHRALIGPLAAWLLLLAPVALVVAPGGSAAERYFLGPSVGLAWALALGLSAGLRRWPVPVAGAAALALLAGGRATAARLPDWQSDEAIFAAAQRDNPGGWFGAFQLGNIRARDGEPREGARLLEQAAAVASERGAPVLATGQIYNALALAYLRLGQGPRALAASRRALGLAPDYPGFHLTAAWSYAANNQLEAELAELDRTLALSPDFHRARGFRALARALAGDRAGARADLGYLEARGAAAQPDWAEEAAEARAQLDGPEDG